MSMRFTEEPKIVYMETPTPPGCRSVEAYMSFYPAPIAILWYSTTVDWAIEIINLYIHRSCRDHGIALQIVQSMRERFPGKRFVTGRSLKYKNPLLRSFVGSKDPGDQEIVRRRTQEDLGGLIEIIDQGWKETEWGYELPASQSEA